MRGPTVRHRNTDDVPGPSSQAVNYEINVIGILTQNEAVTDDFEGHTVTLQRTRGTHSPFFT